MAPENPAWREGYYEPHALVRLSRPLAVAGYLGAENRAVARRAAALLGLGFSDTDRLVEHRLGEDLASLLGRGKLKVYRSAERAVVERLMRDVPSVVALGDGTLIDRRQRDLVLRGCDVVLLDRDLSALYWKIRSFPAETSWRYGQPRPRGFEELRPFYEARRLGFDLVSKRLQVRGEEPGQVADRVVALLRQ